MERNQALDSFNLTSETQPREEEPISNISTELILSIGFVQRKPEQYDDFGSNRTSNSMKTTITTHYSSGASKTKPNSLKAVRSKRLVLGLNEEKQWCCSTALKLYDDPWKVKKVLTASDLGKLNRLLLGTEMVESFVLPVLSADARRDAETNEGTTIKVWDVDTMSMHQLVLKRWASFRNYVLISNWNNDFVKRRGLKGGDEIGLHWDSYKQSFNFSVLKLA